MEHKVQGKPRLTRKLFIALAAAAMTLVQVIVLPGTAAAGGYLPPNVWFFGNGAQPLVDDYTIYTTRQYWSIVVLNSDFLGGGTNLDYDLDVLSFGNVLGSSQEFAPFADFIAIDSNLRAPQPYTARVRQFLGTTTGPQYQIEYHEGNRTLSAGRTVLPADGSRHAFVADIFVPAGRTVRVTVAKDIAFCPNTLGPNFFNVFLMASNPAAPVQGRNAAESLSKQAHPGEPGPCGLTISDTVSRTGYYGLVIYQQVFEQTLIDISIQ
jgi:hypothetical protein